MSLALDTQGGSDTVGLPDINSRALNHFAMLLEEGDKKDGIYTPAPLWD